MSNTLDMFYYRGFYQQIKCQTIPGPRKKNRYTGAPYHIFVSLCIHNSESYIPCDSTRIEHRVWRTCNFRFEAMYLSWCADEMNQTHTIDVEPKSIDFTLFGFVWDVYFSLGYWILIINSDRQSIRRSHQIHHQTIDKESSSRQESKTEQQQKWAYFTIQ